LNCEKKVLPELRFVVSDTTQKEAIGCPRCKTAMQEVARTKPLQQAQGLIAYACPSCRYTFSETLPARGRGREE
jgi:transposase-like protein